MNRLKSFACAALVSGAALTAVALGGLAIAADNPAVTTRQANYKELQRTMGGINAELQKEAPDMALVKAGAAKVRELASHIPSWFPAGSGPETGMKTAAKPEVWSDGKGFAAAAKHLQDETVKLQTIADAGDLEAVKAQTKATSAACKACHDVYRVPLQRPAAAPPPA
jgi:cytochrome c556